MWSINYKRNNDKVSKKYIKDSITDKEKLQLYVNALELIRKLNISGALEILKQCENSHFNFINVNNHISSCYIKQGEYDKALHYVNEVLKVDKKNTQAIINKKTLIEYGNLKREINYKKIFIASASIFLTITILILVKEFMYKSSNLSIRGIKVQTTKAEENKENTQVEKKTTNVNEEKAIENKPKEIPKFPQEQFKESIKSNNMEQIIGYVNKWKNADLEINDKLLLAKGEEIIKNTGVVYFYEKGIYYINDKKFNEAQKYLLYALPYSKDNYLHEHIIYMLALSYKSISDFENAVKYYELTLKQFPSGSYTQEVIYNLILINKDIDIDKAKSYADKLVRQFPHSQYYNSIVKEIVASKK